MDGGKGQCQKQDNAGNGYSHGAPLLPIGCSLVRTIAADQRPRHHPNAALPFNSRYTSRSKQPTTVEQIRRGRSVCALQAQNDHDRDNEQRCETLHFVKHLYISKVSACGYKMTKNRLINADNTSIEKSALALHLAIKALSRPALLKQAVRETVI
jgi:hypothetical protein